MGSEMCIRDRSYREYPNIVNKAIIVDGVISSPKITYTEKVNKRSCINAVSAIKENLYSYLNDIRSAIMDKNITSALIPLFVISSPKVGPTL